MISILTESHCERYANVFRGYWCNTGSSYACIPRRIRCLEQTMCYIQKRKQRLRRRLGGHDSHPARHLQCLTEHINMCCKRIAVLSRLIFTPYRVYFLANVRLHHRLPPTPRR